MYQLGNAALSKKVHRVYRKKDMAQATRVKMLCWPLLTITNYDDRVPVHKPLLSKGI